jgi:tetraacyldisaccharide 4'-kinase
MRDPTFWWTEPGIAAAFLAPVAAGYGAVAAWRMARRGRTAPVPVICVGNFTLGGAGKTPTAIAIAQLLRGHGQRPFFLSRGHGGRLPGPVRVDLHDARQVGDEPLLLARTAPVIVSRDRPAGAIVAAHAGADVIVMDDGLQNPSLAKDLAIAVVDGRRGIGNGCVFPAGPLRAPIAVQLDHIDAILLIGAPGRDAETVFAAARGRGLPILEGELHPDPTAVAALAGKPLLAFAGIADPGKFFATLEACGLAVAVRQAFADHHRFTAAEMAALMARARSDGLTLVTTEKDFARLQDDPIAQALRGCVKVLPVKLVFRDAAAVGAMVLAAMRGSRARSGADGHADKPQR